MAYQEALPPLEPVSPVSPPKHGVSWGLGDIVMAIAVVLGGLFIIMLPAAAIVGALAGGELDENDAATDGLAIGATFLVEGLLLAGAVWFSVRKYRASWSSLGLRTPHRGGWWLPGALFAAIFVGFIIYAAVISAVFGDAEGNVPEGFFDSVALAVLLGILTLAVAPFIEEVFFRGFLFGGLRRLWGVPGAALVSGLLFGLAHFQGLDGLPILPMIGIIGIVFALAYHYTGSLFASMGAHFLFNLTSYALGVAGVNG